MVCYLTVPQTENFRLGSIIATSFSISASLWLSELGIAIFVVVVVVFGHFMSPTDKNTLISCFAVCASQNNVFLLEMHYNVCLGIMAAVSPVSVPGGMLLACANNDFA